MLEKLNKRWAHPTSALAFLHVCVSGIDEYLFDLFGLFVNLLLVDFHKLG